MSMVDGILSSQVVGHGCVALDGSHFSGASTIPSPQLLEQSASSACLQPSGQHPSPVTQFVIRAGSLQRASHVAAEPASFTTKQAFEELQLIGQLDPSQSSPASGTPLPHMGVESGDPAAPLEPAIGCVDVPLPAEIIGL
jgi:hypothetical protein